MRLKIYALIFMLVTAVGLQAQVWKTNGFRMEIAGEGSADRQLGNAMVDMVANGTSLWAGSGYGLNRTDDSGMTWTGFTSADYIGKG
ncbi:MAG: hypothetical protein E4H13_01980, partial [Calditrichales bacterium]